MIDIKMNKITIGELWDGYQNKEEDGVVAYHGKLNVRPAYQREFIYGEKEQKAVINTVINNFPLNVIYWVVKEDGTYELLDGQQRTMSICEFLDGKFHIMIDGMPKTYDNLTPEKKKEIKDYELLVYFCSNGTLDEQLSWFKTINIAGLKLTDQELRNAIYTGSWLSDAKKYFSRRKGPAYKISKDYIKAEIDRQGFLETALKWISNKENISIEEYMSIHQNETNASDLWIYFQSVINWIKTIFPNYRAEMKGINWGVLYNRYGSNSYDPIQFEKRIIDLFKDDDISNHKGIYEYLLSGEKEEKVLSIRAFDNRMRRYAYEIQNHQCVKCGKTFELEEMHADHITPWSKGGKTIQENCQMLCADCNRRKSDV